jgi:predicted amidohydrolase
MRDPLILSVAQPVCTPYDVAANVLIQAGAVRAASSRVVVFPELSLTGYELDSPTLTVDDPRLLPLVDACAETGSLALVGAPVPGAGERPQIAMLAVSGDGVRVAYRKQWLGASESPRFEPGDSPAVLEVDGWRLGLAICRDTGIAKHAADTAALGIDAYVAGTLMADEETDIQNERGQRLSLEHRIWVAFASFAGSTGDGYDRAAGRSAIWAPDGEIAAQSGPEAGAIASATLTDRKSAPAAH